MRVALIARCLLFAGALTRVVLAEGPPLSWQAPEQCGGQAGFEAGISRIVGRSWQNLSSLWASASLSIALVPDGYELRLSVISPGGAQLERRVTARTCAEVVDAAELIVATSLAGIEPEPAGDVVPPSAPPSTQQEPVAPARPVDKLLRAPGVSRREAPQRPRAARVYGAARMGLTTDLLPATTESGWAALGLSARVFGVEAFARATGSGARAVSSSGTVQANLLSGGGIAYYRVALGALELRPCIGLELGRFRASGSHIADAHSESALWSALLLQGRVSWHPAGRLALGGGAELGVPFRQLEIRLSPTERPFSSPALELSYFLGLDFGFW